MPQTKSAKKAMRQNQRRRARNLKQKNETKALIRSCRKILAENKKEEAESQLGLIYKKLDKLSKTKVIKKGRANRLKSRLAKKIKKLN